MKLRTLWNERFGAITASGSPGSALAYALGKASTSSALVRRSEATDLTSDPQTSTASEPAMLSAERMKRWLRRAFERIEAWSWAQELREVEAYLAQAQDHADLEERMRRLHAGLLSRARTLR